MQTKDHLRERAQDEAAQRPAAVPAPTSKPTALERLNARARGRLPVAAPPQPNHGGPKQKPIW